MSDVNHDSARLVTAAIVPPLAGTALVYLGAAVMQQYGWVLFLFVPVAMGILSAVIYNYRGDKSYGSSLLVGLSSILIIGLLILATAIEGLICLFMALPLAVPEIAIGVLIGWVIARNKARSAQNLGLSALLFLAMPLFMGFEASTRSAPTLHEVVTTVEVEAPIETVWKNVIEFSEIKEKPEGILRLGFAYPINARIEGRGVGAVRHCNFNTGPFVEPITVWNEPTLLAFDVIEQPEPMTELTPYKDLRAAHLEYIRSQKGQFRLYTADGKTILEGTTFYTHDIAPDIYWSYFSDAIIHRIHLRVLQHIKRISEQSSGSDLTN